MEIDNNTSFETSLYDQALSLKDNVLQEKNTEHAIEWGELPIGLLEELCKKNNYELQL